MDLLSSIATLLRGKLNEEVGTGFSNLRRIPSTATIKFLDYFDALPAAQRDPLLDAIARIGAMQFFPVPLIASEHERMQSGDPAFMQFLAAMRSPALSYGLRYCDLKMARLMLNDRQSLNEMAKMRAGLDFQPRDDPPVELVSDPDLRSVHPAKAPLLRKLVNRALSDLLSAKGIKSPGGEMAYNGSIGITALTIAVDFGSRMGQLRYGIRAAIPQHNLRVWGLTYEALWCANLGWDYLTEENAERSIELLCDRLRFMAAIIEQVGALPREHS